MEMVFPTPMLTLLLRYGGGTLLKDNQNVRFRIKSLRLPPDLEVS